MSSDLDHFYDGLAELFTSEWRKYSNCVDADIRYFSEDHHVADGKKVCAGCPVRIECLDSALYYNDGFLRGGLTESERNSVELHRKRHLAAFRYDLEKSDEG
jgi:WhiB family redox-sensing transcriptional regulator